MADGDAIIIGSQNGGTRPTYLMRSVAVPPKEPTFGAHRWDRGAGSTIYGLFYGGPARAGVGVFGSVTAIAEDRPADGTGVVGRSLDGDGVIGESESAGTGVGGFSDRGVGVFGASSGPLSIKHPNPDIGVFGYSDGTAILGWSPGGGWAGEFRGNVVVAGNSTVLGTKSAAVPHPDGSHRQLYCLESPESWFEDFGEAELVEGHARVALDADFAVLVDATAYHVFLSSYGPQHLYVERRDEEGFDVRAESADSGKTPGVGMFSYRIVAKRKDVDAPRLAPFEVPERPEERLGPLEPRELPEVDLEAVRPHEG